MPEQQTVDRVARTVSRWTGQRLRFRPNLPPHSLEPITPKHGLTISSGQNSSGMDRTYAHRTGNRYSGDAFYRMIWTANVE